MTNLAQKTTTGVFWNFIEQICRRGIGVLITLLLAKLLMPEDYGLIAMMSVFIELANSLMESGFKQALIRLQDATRIDFNTAFFCNIILGAFSYLALFFAAPFISVFYNEPRLVLLIRVSGLAVIVQSFQVVQIAILNRELNFKLQLKTFLPASVISGVIAIIMAYNGSGVWALIAQTLLAVLLATVFLWKKQDWRPRFEFNAQSASRMYSFGYKLFLSGMLNTVFVNLYVIVISKCFNSSIAGLYFFANRIRELVVTQLVSSIQTVTYPALAKMQDDNVRLKAGYRKVVAVTTFLLFPCMLSLVVLARPVFQVFLSDKWLPAVPFLQLMCLAAILIPLHSLNLNILNVKGRSDLFLWLEIIKRTTAVLILLASLKYGIYGILIGQILSSTIGYFPNSYYSSKLIDYPVKEQLTDVAPVFVLAFVSAATVYYFGSIFVASPLVKLFVLTFLAVVFYLTGAKLFGLHAYQFSMNLLKKRIRG